MNLGQRRFEFLVVVVLQPRAESPENLRAAAAAHGHDKREAELLFVGVVQGLELFVLDPRTLVQPGARLFRRRVDRELTRDLRLARKVGMRADERQLLFGIGIVDTVGHELRDSPRILEPCGQRCNEFGNPG